MANGKSWVEAANDPACGFPLENLPYCAFAAGDAVHLGAGIADRVLDLAQMSRAGLLSNLGERMQAACEAATLNALMQSGPAAWALLRETLTAALSADAPATLQAELRPLLLPVNELAYRLPVRVGNYSDFYASLEHATRTGSLFRPDDPLPANYKWVPIGYHGRASSLVVGGGAIRRPWGQSRAPGEAVPSFRPSAQLDYELELGAYIGADNELGAPIPVGSADEHIFGYCLLNDWSARDLQSWEYQPLGPFLGKSFATGISPWVVSRAALLPYRVPRVARPEGDPEPLAYLDDRRAAEPAAIDMTLEVWLCTARKRTPMPVSRSNLRGLYWSFAQMIAHHTSNGCNLEVGDLLGSGTVSGATAGTEGCLLERTRRGAVPLQLSNGEERTFLEDGDEVILRGFCERPGLPRLSLGECRGTVAPAAGA